MNAPARVFISATSGDLGSVRQLVKEALLSMDCHPVEQTNFPPDYRTVQEMLQEKIASCQAVIHIVGLRYGAEPDPAKLPTGTPRRSYTQMEYDLARKLNKKVYVFICPEAFPYDQAADEMAEQQQLQREHRATLVADPRLRTKVTSREELAVKVRELQLELQQLRQQVLRGTRNVLIGIAAIALVLCGIGYGIARLTGLIGGTKKLVTDVHTDVKEIHKTVEDIPQKTRAEIQKLFEDPDVLIGKLKSQIRQKAEEQLAVLRSDSANWRKIDEIEKLRDQQLDRVEEMVSRIREGLSGKPDPIFAEAAKILAEKGVDEAIEFLQAKQPAIESRVKSTKARADQATADFHSSLEPWLLEADLHKTKLEWADALRHYENVVAEAPQWSRGHLQLGDLLRDLARFSEAEPHLQAAFQQATNDAERSRAGNSLGRYFMTKARWAEAEPLLEQLLELVETLYGPNDPETAVRLNSVAQFLQATNRLAEAELLMRRALVIDEQSYGTEHPNVAARLNNLAHLLLETDRLAEAEPLMRRALAIDEKSNGAEHPAVALKLWGLAILLGHSERLSKAIPLMERLVDIFRRFAGRNMYPHPRWAIVNADYRAMLKAMERSEDEIERHLHAVSEVTIPLEPIGPEIERLLGAARPVKEVLAALDEEYKKQSKPAFYFLPANQPISPHLDELLGRSSLDVPLDEAIAPYLDKLLGPSKPVDDVLKALDERYKKEGKPPIYFLSSDQPNALHLDELLGPSKLDVPMDQPISPHLDKLLGPIGEN